MLGLTLAMQTSCCLGPFHLRWVPNVNVVSGGIWTQINKRFYRFISNAFSFIISSGLLKCKYIDLVKTIGINLIMQRGRWQV